LEECVHEVDRCSNGAMSPFGWSRF
jgi:hypothetical protein